MLHAPPALESLKLPADRQLRVAMVAPPWFEVPPVGYGGTEAVVGNLVNGLVAAGHHVTLFAAGANGTSAQVFVQIFETPPTEYLGDPMPEMAAAVEVERHLQGLEFDVIHDHSLAGPLLAPHRLAPTVVTVHGLVTGWYGSYYERLGTEVSPVAISADQRARNDAIQWAGMVHNAIDVSSYTADATKDDYVLWLGRFCEDKAPHLAIDAARKRRRKIVLAGKCNEAPERAFFEREIAPRLGPDVEYVGEADAELKRELLARAAVLAFPIQWDEPFGMVMAEALASGTPIVAFPRGSVPEVVQYGKTGFVARDLDGFASALDAARGLDPKACRADAVARFDLPVMARGYGGVYAQAVRVGTTAASL